MKITQNVRNFAAKQNSDNYLASGSIKRENLAEEAQEAREEMRVRLLFSPTGHLFLRTHPRTGLG